ncbi:maleylpyruvate isomerase family mycothiol-dependent enzyme [Catenulispora sp. NL8]|uniref:Maleylpyruvate isomerase family mycothiol-dependent enzyme n=1 Tax=Catenulispora pinistramenti TaxID=2705254 RepID=A0ABS5L8Q0_9ACTN|nr:maleylpyruvate isomerase family mycothiol-dependent enzyme [Catenulispora pinistramenti]MBS2554738.1 maleylpyruvate isomerase family mycothiol-dependent enzyme [Catenulispora pinistramenti]
MTSLGVELDQVRDSDARLLATVSGLDGARLRGPSLLPGWSRAHVVVHLARNADAQLRMIDAALRGQSVEQYPGGEQGRAREIEEGVTADAEDIVAGLVASTAALEQRWATLPEQAWELETVTLRFRRTVREGIAARWREVEIHHVDLGCGYEPAAWPVEFVGAFLERTVARLPTRMPGTEESGLRWRLVDRDTMRSWRVDGASVQGGDGAADAEVSGSGWQLLAWLVGRGDYGLEVAGKADRLPDLAAYG